MENIFPIKQLIQLQRFHFIQVSWADFILQYDRYINIANLSVNWNVEDNQENERDDAMDKEVEID